MTAAATPALPVRSRRWPIPTSVSHYCLWAATLVVVVGPVVPIVVASLWSTPLYESGGTLTLENFSRLFQDSRWWSAVGNSVVFAAVATSVSVVLGTALAVLLTRTDLPARRLINGLLMLPVVLPGLTLILGWATMWAPFGFANSWLRTTIGVALPFDLYSLPGMIAVAISVITPVVFLLARGALAGVDTSLEDAARAAGARPLRALLSTTVPLLRPALLNSTMLVFVLALEVLGLPLILGSSSNVFLISSYLYDNWVQKVPADQGLVSAGAVCLLTVVTLLLLIRNRVAGDTSRFTTTTGKPKAPSTVRLGVLRWPLSVLILLGLVVGVLIPLCGILLAAFTSVLSPFVNPFTVLTTAQFGTVFANSSYVDSIVNSLLIATVGGVLATAAVAILSMVAHRSTFRHRSSLQQAMLWPRTMPGLVTGMAFFWTIAVLNPGGALRDSLWAIGLAFAVRHLAIAYSAFYPALVAVGNDLDRAARTSGARWWTAIRTVVLPLVRPATGVAFILLFVAMLNESDPAVFLVTPDNPVMGLTMLQLSVTGTGGPVAAFGVIQMLLTLAVLAVGRLLFGARPHV
ncbi:ABC transporter permease [Amycolatopsis thermoflava]